MAKKKSTEAATLPGVTPPAVSADEMPAELPPVWSAAYKAMMLRGEIAPKE